MATRAFIPPVKQTGAQMKLQQLRDTLASLQARRKLLSKEALATKPTSESLDQQQATTGVESEALAMAKKTNQEHVRLLTQYNEMKDVATGLIGMIAENRQERIKVVMQDFDVDEND